VTTFKLDAEYQSAWQLQWVHGGSPAAGNIAFTDRIGNQVGFLDPVTGEVSRPVKFQAITEPNGIAAVDPFTFAVAGDGGAAFFDSRGAGKVTELSMSDGDDDAERDPLRGEPPRATHVRCIGCMEPPLDALKRAAFARNRRRSGSYAGAQRSYGVNV
jgi:hypothetical protein